MNNFFLSMRCRRFLTHYMQKYPLRYTKNLLFYWFHWQTQLITSLRLEWMILFRKYTTPSTRTLKCKTTENKLACWLNKWLKRTNNKSIILLSSKQISYLIALCLFWLLINTKKNTFGVFPLKKSSVQVALFFLLFKSIYNHLKLIFW